ncbi:MAG: hypothetical protein OEZ59_09285 [Deltaproteobacteria bacterium]|nr:hypothetical protein [Deltaproteobacteria bacterium]
MSLNTDQQDALAREIQHRVPFVIHPFDVIGEKLDISPDQVLEQLRQWSAEGKLREICGVLEGDLLGYESALIAARVPDNTLERVVEILNAHPTVTHNYMRNHDFNVWFTLAAPREMGLENHLTALSRLTGLADLHPMRRTCTFKIGVNFGLKNLENSTESRPGTPSGCEESEPPRPMTPTEREKIIFRAMQTPLPLDRRPFARLAESLGLEEDEIIGFGKTHLGGALRRYMATFRHRKLGVRGNGMVVWNVPPEQLQEKGMLLASQPEVSHCYARESFPAFPYSLYTMIHGADEEHCRQTTKRLAQTVEIDEYLILFSSREFKKCRLRYFLPELEDWWRTNGSVPGQRKNSDRQEGENSGVFA